MVRPTDVLPQERQWFGMSKKCIQLPSDLCLIVSRPYRAAADFGDDRGGEMRRRPRRLAKG